MNSDLLDDDREQEYPEDFSEESNPQRQRALERNARRVYDEA